MCGYSWFILVILLVLYFLVAFFPLFLVSIYGKLGIINIKHCEVLSVCGTKMFMGLGEIIPEDFNDVCEDKCKFFAFLEYW